MKINNLGETNSLFNQFISEVRNVAIQSDAMRFRRNMERIGEIIAYEISKTLTYEKRTITTPLGEVEMNLLKQQPVLATILRAGLPLHQGFLNYFDRAENAFISAFRKHDVEGNFEIQIDYMSSPILKNRTLIIVDPMLATGKSMVLTYKALLSMGAPKHIHIVSVIASTDGIEYLQKYLPASKTSIWVGAIDYELTAQSYIVPGLGDAGDLAFGEKI
ncbi:MAG: uracil phosphoribosyltransferase [Bacteroidetes bacterium]|nr:uracil phosphoribosyltransferase [Bacteroidota bacterium]MCL1969194.1 uracil phosphoribosyltransferase [Bacteroidota bacterium]